MQNQKKRKYPKKINELRERMIECVCEYVSVCEIWTCVFKTGRNDMYKERQVWIEDQPQSSLSASKGDSSSAPVVKAS